MKHYNEEEIGVFALGGSNPGLDEEEFFEHLKICYSCRELYEDISSYYDLVVKTPLMLKSAVETQKADSIVLKTRYIERSTSKLVRFVSYFLPYRFIEFVYQKPVMVSSNSFVFAAALLFVLNFKSIFLDNNPIYYKHNDENRMLEIYNKDGEKLWQIKYSVQIGERESMSQRYSQVSDLDKDGKNEIITILPLNSQEARGKFLYILDYKGNLILKKEFDENFRFRDQRYFPDFHTDNLLIYEHDGNEKNEIFIFVGHLHQPCKLIRLDYKGNILGEYWHFGGIPQMILMDLNKDGKKEIVMGGIEDIEHNAALLALDPSRIIGKTESSQTKGFGYKTSEAEISYIRFPNPEFVDALNSRSVIIHINPVNDTILITSYKLAHFQNEYGQEYSLLYYFGLDLKLKSVMVNDVSQSAHLNLIKSGKLPKNFNENKFLENLKNNLEYWNGKEWKKEWCRVRVQ
jgi:hypothetical protein